MKITLDERPLLDPYVNYLHDKLSSRGMLIASTSTHSAFT
jgi:hypothetical protein